MKRISTILLLVTMPLFSVASDLKIDGEYTQVGTCKCETYYQGNTCAEAPLAVHALVKSSLAPLSFRWSAETAENIAGDEGNPLVVPVWLYPRSQKVSDEFRVGAFDQLSYKVSVLSSGRGFAVTVTNLSRPQQPLVINLEAPPDQHGGRVDGPAEYKTVIDDSLFQHSSYEVFREAGGAVGPRHSPWGTKHILEMFQIKRAQGSTLSLVRIFDYRFSVYGIRTPKTFNYGLQSCVLRRVAD
nr:hypothetical protein HAGR004_15610 [Bdellovibrio sp. HAGR004]